MVIHTKKVLIAQIILSDKKIKKIDDITINKSNLYVGKQINNGKLNSKADIRKRIAGNKMTSKDNIRNSPISRVSKITKITTHNYVKQHRRIITGGSTKKGPRYSSKMNE